MNNFIKALESKIADLEKEKAHLEDKIGLLDELIASELSEGDADLVSVPAQKKKKGGRPKGSKNRARKNSGGSPHAIKDDLYEEAMRQLSKSEEGGTSKELQEKLTRRFDPQPREKRSLGVGIIAGTKKQVEEARGAGPKSNASVSVDESDLGDD